MEDKEKYTLYKIFNQHFKAHKEQDGVTNLRFSSLGDISSLVKLPMGLLKDMVDELRPFKGLLIRTVDDNDLTPDTVYCDLHQEDDRYMVYDFIGRLDGTSDPLGYSLEEALIHINKQDLFNALHRFVVTNRDLVNIKPISIGSHYIRMIIPTEILPEIDISRAMSTGLDDSVVRPKVKEVTTKPKHSRPKIDCRFTTEKGGTVMTHESADAVSEYLKVASFRIPIAANNNKPIKGYKINYAK